MAKELAKFKDLDLYVAGGIAHRFFISIPNPSLRRT